MIYLHLGQRHSQTAQELLRRVEGQTWPSGPSTPRLGRSDLVINWGSRRLPQDCLASGSRLLNREVPTKREAIDRLNQAQIRTIRLVDHSDEWLVRDASHRGGQDLLKDRLLVVKEPIVEEYRVHSWMGKSLRTAVKVPARPDHHPWIRSHLSGWKFSYDPDRIPKGIRKLAHQAVQALGLDFGAVDLGQLEDGTFMVLEVNSAPGLEGQTFDRYAEAIRQTERAD